MVWAIVATGEPNPNSLRLQNPPGKRRSWPRPGSSSSLPGVDRPAGFTLGAGSPGETFPLLSSKHTQAWTTLTHHLQAGARLPDLCSLLHTEQTPGQSSQFEFHTLSCQHWGLKSLGDSNHPAAEWPYKGIS